MTLTALLVCPDPSTSLLLKGVLEDLNINVEVNDQFDRAAIRLSQERFDALILDCGSKDAVLHLLRESQASRQENSTLTIAILQNQESVRELFSLGANFIIYQPVTRERAVSSLRAARALMRKERRGRGRAPIHAHAKIDYASAEQQKATLIDLGEDGMAIHFAKKLPPSGKVYFQFQLPGQSSAVKLSGQVMWQDWNGRAGIQFKDVPQASRRLLREWLERALANTSAAGVISSVEVHPETEAAEENPELSADRYAARPKADEDATSARMGIEAGNRREQPRYTCRLGAEVYLKGSSVRNFCNLGDVSPGGCYLEMPMVFPVGSFIELTLRTGDLKVRVSGQIQSSHPGYGMGVSFRMEGKADQERVQELIDLVAAAEQTES